MQCNYVEKILIKFIGILCLKTIKEEIVNDYDMFMVKIIQLYYNDEYEEYMPKKEEIITDKVCI